MIIKRVPLIRMMPVEERGIFMLKYIVSRGGNVNKLAVNLTLKIN